MSTRADAEVIFSGPVNLFATIPTTGFVIPVREDFTIQGIEECLIVFNEEPGPNKRFGGASIRNGSSRGLSFATANGSVKKYAPGQPILAQGPFTTAVYLRVHGPYAQINGPFGPGTVSGFIGFKNPVNNTLGWIQVKVFDRNSDSYPDQAEVIAWAYNNTPGGPIRAGEAPEPSSFSLALLALGASGLTTWRRRRAAQHAG
jgi:hypothetical protein